MNLISKLFKPKTPVSYYGGKQQMAQKITDLIPTHTLYCEPFFGWGAVFFKKESSAIEAIGDKNGTIANFYSCCKDPDLFPYLQRLIESTPYARIGWAEAKVVRQNPDAFSPLKRARSFRILAALSFSGNIASGFAYDRTVLTVWKRFNNKKKEFGSRIMHRLENTCIENMDALELIKSRDAETSFFYLDPPYISESIGSKQGKGNKVDQWHYNGYTVQDYDNLLQLLGTLKGKFLLSNYPSDLLDKYIGQYGRYVQRIEKSQQAGLKLDWVAKNTKVEMLVANYPLPAISV